MMRASGAITALWITAAAGAAAAATELVEYGDDLAARPSAQLYEAACELDIELRGAIAVAELRQRIVHPGPGPRPGPAQLAAALELELPAGAVVVGFAARARGLAGYERGLAVAAQSPSIEHDGAHGVVGVDPAFLQRAPGGTGARVIVQPLAAGHDLTLITRYAAIARPRAGALRLVIPGRDTSGAAGKLTVCRATLRATPGPGAVVRRIRVGGAAPVAGARASFVVERDTTVDVELDVAGAQPIAWAQTEALAEGWSASLVTVLAPPTVAKISAPGARRVVFVIDGSRSMDLVGRHHVARVIERVGAALPAGAEVEAIVFDRAATRVFGELRPATAPNLAAIGAALAGRSGTNGSDLAGAFALARRVIDPTEDAAPRPAGGAGRAATPGRSTSGGRGQAMVVVITDGVIGEVDGADLIKALGAKTSTVDVHAIVLDPATTRSPGADALRAPVNLYGGAYVEVAVDQLDDALASIDEWLRPSWLELALGPHAIPTEVRAGGGFTALFAHRAGVAGLALTGRGEAAFRAGVRAAPAAPIGALALAELGDTDDFPGADPDRLDAMLMRARAAHPSAATHAFAVLSNTGKIAKHRHAVVAGGGRYERVIAVRDPELVRAVVAVPAAPAPPPSAIAKLTLERMFRTQLQPKAFLCYQRALGRDAKLDGTVQFRFLMGRGEVTEVSLVGLGDAQLDACLLDAGYQLAPPLPDFSVNADDQTIANYPLTLTRRADQPYIVLGDADSTSPLDIDAIQGGVPSRGRPIELDKKSKDTPLGNLRPPK